MKTKKRKSTAFWLPRLREAVRTQKIWVRKTQFTYYHQNNKGYNHYEIAVGADLFAIDEKYRRNLHGVPQYVPGCFRVCITDTGKQLMYTVLDEYGENARVKFTTDAEAWFQETIGQIIAMYRMGAYASAATDRKTTGLKIVV